MSLTITNTHSQFILDAKEAIDLELKLNVSAYGHEWKHIGDVLYNFGSKRSNDKLRMTLEVEADQYKFLGFLKTKNGYASCSKLSLADV